MATIYSTVSALFRDTKLADKIEQTPCCLDERLEAARRALSLVLMDISAVPVVFTVHPL